MDLRRLLHPARHAWAAAVLGALLWEARCSSPDTVLATGTGTGGGAGGSDNISLDGGGVGEPCTSGQTEACYDGPPATQNVGACKDGVRTCTPSGSTEVTTGTWGAACVGETLPATEICGNGIDDDCNGVIDDGCSDGGSDAGACDPTVGKPQPIAPVSTGRVSNSTPTFRWKLPAGLTGAHLTLCHDRACSSVITAMDVTGTSTKLTTALQPGVVFWKLEGLGGGGKGCDGPVWEFTVGHRSTPVDTSWGTQLDVDGDGYADVLVADVGGGTASGDGSVYVYRGGPTGLATTPATTLRSPSSAAAQFGHAVAGAGDVNGDGYADVIVGTGGYLPGPGCSTQGYTTDQAYVYLGGPSGVSTTPFAILAGPHVDTMTCSPDYFGLSVAAAGDVNGDGYGDVLVFAQLAHEVYLYYGSATGLVATPVVLPGGAYGSSGNQPGAGAGDVNGDGYADIVVASEQQGMSSAVYLGSAAGLSTTPVYLQVPGFRPEMFTIGAGDIDGDGYADVLGSAGAVNQGDNLLYVYRGGAAGIDTTPTVLIAPRMESWPLTAAGDVNGDGFSDVALWSNTQVSPGVNPLDVYLASASGLAASPSKSLTLTVSDDALSASVTSAGDVNRDGYADVLVGSKGQAQLFLGGPGGLTLPSAETLTTPVTPATYYGWATGASGAGF